MLVAFLRILAILSLLYLTVCVLAWRYQDRLAFPSPRGLLPVPADVRIKAARRITVRTSDGVDISGWYFLPTATNATGKFPGVVWFYGNMETVTALAPVLEEFHHPGTGVVVLDYRGYGENPGTLGLTGHETFDVSGVASITPGGTVDVAARRDDGAEVRFAARVRIDTPTELHYFREGGILPAVLRKMLATA